MTKLNLPDMWDFKLDEINCRPLKGIQKEEMIKLRAQLSEISVRFRELVGDFSPLAARMGSKGGSRVWGNNLIRLEITRYEELYLMEVSYREPKTLTSPNFSLGFELEGNNFTQVQVTPYSACGKKEDILILANEFIVAWPDCHRLHI